MAQVGRKPNAVPTIEWKFHIPVDLAAQVELLLKDPVRDKVKYGERSKLLETLLRQWIESKRTVQGAEDGG